MARITKDPDVRRQEILDTAAKLFCEKGYDRTSMADIAKAMNVAQGLCYRYFPSKDALFEAAVDYYAQRQARGLIAILRSEGTLREKLDALPVFTDGEPEDAYFQMAHGEAAKGIHDRLSLAICELVTPHAAEAIARSNETGETAIPAPEDFAAFCVYGQLGILLRDGLTPEEKRRRIHTMLLRLCGFV